MVTDNEMLSKQAFKVVFLRLKCFFIQAALVNIILDLHGAFTTCSYFPQEVLITRDQMATDE